MSHIAKNTLFANSVQAVLALLALAGLVITGIFTYRAANAAVDAAKHGQIAATAGTIAAKAARESADIANKALVADTRAWMTPAQVHVLDIRIDQHNINVAASFISRNIGKSPALRVTILPQLFISEQLPTAMPEELAMQAYSRFQNDGYPMLAGAIFPERETVVDIQFSMSIQETMEHMRRFVSMFQGLRGVGTDGTTTISSEIYQFIIAGCVAYKTADSDTIWATGFSYYMRRVGTPMKAINVKEPQFIKGSEIETREIMGGTFAV